MEPSWWTAPLIAGRVWFDFLLLLYLALVFLLEAALIRRESRLGWSMAVTRFVLALVFLSALALGPTSSPTSPSPVAIAIRLGLGVVLIGEVYEMWRAGLFLRRTG